MSEPSLLSNLPLEIRTTIYGMIFEGPGGSIDVSEDDQGRVHIFNIPSPSDAIRSTCHAIRDETHGYVKYDHVVFRTQYKDRGVNANNHLPRLAFTFAASRFRNVETICVGATNLWRIVQSFDTLRGQLPRVDLIKVPSTARLPHRHWRDKFPTITSALTAAEAARDVQACHAVLRGPDIPEREIARFRQYVRSRTRITATSNRYFNDRGNELFAQRTDLPAECGVSIRVCSRWQLVDSSDIDLTRLALEITYDLASGRFVDLQYLPRDPVSSGPE